MRFAIQASGGTYDDVLEWARFAESRDLDAFAIPDHYLSGTDDEPKPALDALAVMAGLARDTVSIPLVLLVSPITWRHPAVLAKTAATLADMSGGRVTVGVGAGWWELEHTLFGIPFPERAERFAMLEEALAYLRSAFADPPVDFVGDHFSFTAFDMQPRPPLRLVVGGTGSMGTPRLAGTYADEFNAYPAPFDVYAEKVARARRFAEASGRDPAALELSCSAPILAGDSRSAFADRLEAAAAAVGRTPDQLEAGLRQRNSPHGRWADVRQTLDGYAEQGVRRFYVQTFADDRARIEEVLSQLAG